MAAPKCAGDRRLSKAHHPTVLAAVFLLGLATAQAVAVTTEAALIAAVASPTATVVTIGANITLASPLSITSSLTIRSSSSSAPFALICADGNGAVLDIMGPAVSVELDSLIITGCTAGSGSVISSMISSLTMTNVVITDNDADVIVDFAATTTDMLSMAASAITQNSANTAVMRVASAVPIGVSNDGSALPTSTIKGLLTNRDWQLDPAASVGVDPTGRMTQLVLSACTIDSNHVTNISGAVVALTGTRATLSDTSFTLNRADSSGAGAARVGTAAAATAPPVKMIASDTGVLDFLNCQINLNYMPGALIWRVRGVGTLSLRNTTLEGNAAASLIQQHGYTIVSNIPAYTAARLFLESTIYTQRAQANYSSVFFALQQKRASESIVRDSSKADSRLYVSASQFVGNNLTVALLNLTGDDPSNASIPYFAENSTTLNIAGSSFLRNNVQNSGDPTLGLMYGSHFNGIIQQSGFSSNIGPRLFSLSSCDITLEGTTVSSNVVGNRIMDNWYCTTTMGGQNVFSNNEVASEQMINVTSSDCYLNDTSFTGNKVAAGALMLLQSGAVQLNRLTFDSNAAPQMLQLQQGDCPICTAGTTLIQGNDLVFTNNQGGNTLELGALQRLGLKDDVVPFLRPVFNGNQPAANGVGAALEVLPTYAPDGNSAQYTQATGDVAVVNGSFLNNGAALRVEQQQLTNTSRAGLAVSGSNFTGNAASDGPALYFAGTTLVVNGSSFSYNTASHAGGAVVVLTPGVNSVANFTGCQFIGNRAEGTEPSVSALPAGAGGAIAMNASWGLVEMDDCTFTSNFAHLGGVAYVLSDANCSALGYSCGFKLVDAAVVNNTVSDGGGSIIGWSRNDVVQVCCGAANGPCSTARQALQCPNWANNEPVGNQAYDYNGYASSPVRMVLLNESENSTLTSFDGQIISGQPVNVTLTVLDNYGNPVIGYGAPVTVNLTASDDSLFVLGNKSVNLSPQGRVSFSDIQIQPSLHSPDNGTYQIEFVGVNDGYLEAYVLNFRLPPCPLGTHEDLYRCIQCDDFSYSLNSSISSCEPCPVGGNCTGGTLVPQDGYWQASLLLPEQLPCPLDKACTSPQRNANMQRLLQLLPPSGLLLNPKYSSQYAGQLAGGGLNLETAASESDAVAAGRRLLQQLQLTNVANTTAAQSALAVYARALQLEECADGYTGLMCGTCSPGYGRFGRRCVQCYSIGANTIVYLLVLILMGLVICFTLFTHIKSKEKQRAEATSQQAWRFQESTTGPPVDPKLAALAAKTGQHATATGGAPPETLLGAAPGGGGAPASAAAAPAGYPVIIGMTHPATMPVQQSAQPPSYPPPAAALLHSHASGASQQAYPAITPLDFYRSVSLESDTWDDDLIRDEGLDPTSSLGSLPRARRITRDVLLAGGDSGPVGMQSGGSMPRTPQAAAAANGPTATIPTVPGATAAIPAAAGGAAPGVGWDSAERLDVVQGKDVEAAAAATQYPAASARDKALATAAAAQRPAADGTLRMDKLSSISSMVKVLVTYVQITSMARNLNIAWPGQLANFFQYFDFSSTSNWVSTDCSTTGGAERRRIVSTVVTILLPVIFMAIALPAWVLIWWVQRRRPARRQDTELSARNYLEPRCVATLIQIAYYLYPIVTTAILSIFDCLDVNGPSTTNEIFYANAANSLTGINGGDAVADTGVWITGSFWQQNYNTRCYDSAAHRALTLAVGVPGLIIFAAGVPVSFALLLILNRRHLKEHNVQLKYGFLYQEYRSGLYYWESLVMGRKALLLLVTVFLGGQKAGVYLQLYTAAIISVTFMLMQEVLLPLRNRTLNLMERTSLYTNTVTFVALAYLLIPDDQLLPGSALAVSVIIYLINLAALAYFLYNIACVVLEVIVELLDEDKDGRISAGDLRAGARKLKVAVTSVLQSRRVRRTRSDGKRLAVPYDPNVNHATLGGSMNGSGKLASRGIHRGEDQDVRV